MFEEVTHGTKTKDEGDMFEEVTHGTKTKDEEDPTKGLEDKTNCYRRKMIICYLIVLYNLSF